MQDRRSAAVSCGGQSRASFERQDKLGPLTATTQAVKTKERHKATGLQNMADAENIDRSKALEAVLQTNYSDSQDESDASIGALLIANFVPPVPAAELLAKLHKLVRQLGVSEDLQDIVVTAAKTRLDKIDPAKAGLHDIKAAVKAAMEDESIDVAGATTSAVTDGLRAPNGMVFCDTNWGDAAHRTKFAMVVNPMTGDMEMWQMNEDGSEAMPMEDWVNAKWDVTV